MARNGLGSYSIPVTFVTSTTITASDHNSNMADIAAELTNSVAADGQTTITGPIKFAAGSAAAPSLTFASDTDTGLYRYAANSLGAAVNGVWAWRVDSDRSFVTYGAATIGGNLTGAAATFSGALSAASLSTSGNLAAANTTISGTLAAGNTTITGTLSTSGTATLNAANVTNALSAGSISTSGTLAGGNTTLSGTLSAGDTTITGTLSTSGTATLNAANVTNALSAGSISTSGTLECGNTTISGILNATNAQILLNDGSAVDPSIAFSDDLSQDTGFYWISDGKIGVTVDGVLGATFAPNGKGGIVFDNNVTCSGTLTVGGANMPFPAGTAMLFQQTSAPTGWTKSTTHNDKTLRVVSGTASSGGSVAFSTLFARTATDGHSLSTAELSVHNHGVTDPGHDHAVTGGIYGGTTSIGTSAGANSVPYGVSLVDVSSATTGISINNAGSGNAHSHNIDMRVNYVDIIIATKD